jgi:hypothetical protein
MRTRPAKYPPRQRLQFVMTEALGSLDRAAMRSLPGKETGIGGDPVECARA